MNILGLYLTSVLIWGSTWLAITYQFGVVPPTVSVAYRFGLAGFLLLAWGLVRGLRLRFSSSEHLWMAFQGLMLFGVNYVCVYVAETQITSALVAVTFSLIVFLNIAGARVLFGTPFKPVMLIGAALGVVGLILVFLPEIWSSTGKGNAVLGLMLSLFGAVCASAGNLLAARNHRNGLPVLQMNMFGMLYGAFFVAIYALATQQPFVFDWSPRYLLSLGYLAVFGSIIAFGAYLALIGKVGADRAGYTAVAIPIVALLFSAAFEGMQWHLSLGIGILLCLAGNVAVLRARKSAQEQ